MKKIIYLIAALTCFCNLSFGQISTVTLTPTQYVQNVLLGGGVTASNITFTGLSKQIASFTAPVTTSLGIGKGVYLTCGSNGTISGELGPDGPSSLFQSIDNNGSGDSDLDVIAGTGTNDAAVLEFDFIPQSDTVRFRYIFASEEYNDFVNSVNDAFAFILSGVTTPLAPINIALIPGTTTPITINTVNNGNSFSTATGPCTNCTYYRDNVLGSVDCVYDGLTIVLTAKSKVICGEKYHIKIAIADAADNIYDSGVFLEGGSFSSLPPLNVFTTNSNSNIPDSVLVEDCNEYCAYFIRNGNIALKDSFSLQVTGNAILGTDYIQVGSPSFAWPTKLIFAPNQDTIKFCNLAALQDGLAEGSDTIKFEMSSFITTTVSCVGSNTIKFKLYIQDYVPISIGQNDVIVCNGSSTILNASPSSGYPAYTYTLSSPTVNTATLNTGPINSTTIFTITVNDICNKPVTKTVSVTPIPTPTVTATSATVCLGNTVTINSSGASTFTWSTGAVTQTAAVSPTTTTNYTVVGAVGTCTNSAVSTVTVIGQNISITGASPICIGQSSQLTANGGTSYFWNTGATTSTINVTPANNTSYTVSSVISTCTNSAVFTVSIVPIPTVSISGAVVCFGQPAILQASGATTYSWNTGATTSVINVSPPTNTTYTVIGTTVANCTNTAVYTQTIITAKPILSEMNPIVFCLDTVKKVTIDITDGSSPYVINWFIPSGGIIPFDTINTIYYLQQSVTPSSGNYTVVVTDQCNRKDTVVVGITTVDCTIIVPNVITANGDNVNDAFKINGLDNFPNSSLAVYNRWGKQIYTSSNYNNDWKPSQNAGTYFYILNVSDGRKFNGFFQLFSE